MKLVLLSIVIMLVGAIGFIGCQNPSAPVSSGSTSGSDISSLNKMVDGVCVADTTTLWGGRTINEGYVIVWNDEINLYVKYVVTNPGVSINEVHVWAGTDLTNIPMASRPIPGHFPYKFTVGGGQTEYLVTIPLNEIILGTTNYCDQSLYVVTHAALSDTETAFGGNVGMNLSGPGSNGAWWYYYVYTVCCGSTPPPVSYKNETAFAKGGYVFVTDRKANPESLPSLSLIRNRWGWAVNVSSNGTTTYDIWAGAGLNKTSNGTLVGTLTVEKSGSTVTVTYNLTNGNLMRELHVYAGDFSPTTTAPGQYGYTVYFDPMTATHTATFDVDDTNSDGIWIIAHAVAAIPQY